MGPLLQRKHPESDCFPPSWLLLIWPIIISACIIATVPQKGPFSFLTTRQSFLLSAQNHTLTPISVRVEGQGLTLCGPAKFSDFTSSAPFTQLKVSAPLHLTGISPLRVCDLAVPSAWNIFSPDRSTAASSPSSLRSDATFLVRPSLTNPFKTVEPDLPT